MKTGKRTYNIHPLCLPVKRDPVSNLCKMEGTYAKVIDNKNSESRSNELVVTFPCASSYVDSVNGAYSVANDALYFGEKSGEFFNNKFNMRALPYVPRLVVHYGRNYDNAFWTGTDMFFGDGQDYFYPLVSLDVVAHELAHGVTSRNSNLIYIGQSGGINEAFSDITGVVTKKYVMNTLDWRIGYDIIKSPSRALRYMNDPPLDGKSIKNAWLYRPFLNVHYSSGVFNYAFYKMVDAHKMDIYKAYECFLNANLKQWGLFTWFAKGACNVMQACYEAGYDYKAVRKAFRSTWLPLIFCRYWALKTTVFPGETRRNVLVNIDRSPILEVDMRKWRGRGVWATAVDLSVIRVVATTDVDGKNVIVKGNNYVAFPGNHTRVYIKLMSHHQSDVKVELKVLD